MVVHGNERRALTPACYKRQFVEQEKKGSGEKRKGRKKKEEEEREGRDYKVVFDVVVGGECVAIAWMWESAGEWALYRLHGPP